MKKLILIIAVAALALALVPLAVAQTGHAGWKHGHAKFNLVGKVVAVDTSTASDTIDGTITIHVKAGSHIKGLKRTDATFDVLAGAKVWLLTGDGRMAKTLADVAAGDWVKVRGVIDIVKDADGKVVSKTYKIKQIKYRDLTPDETAQ